jgi:hypothetical protein
VIGKRLASLVPRRAGGPKAAGPTGPSHPGTERRAAFGAVIAFAAGAAASTFTTSVASGVAGYQASRALQPLEFTLRVGLLVAAPCMGAILATLVMPRRGVRRPVWAISAGAAVGPLLVLRLDRLLSYGWRSALAGVAALVVWTAASAAVIAAAGTGGGGGRPHPPGHSELPSPPPPAVPPPGSGTAFTATTHQVAR